LLYIILCHSLSARSQPVPDPIAERYADKDTTNIQLRKYTVLYLVKFREFPGKSLGTYGVIRSLSPLHFILKRTNFDSTLQSIVSYQYVANNNWKASTNILNKLSAADSLTIQITATQVPQLCTILKRINHAWIVRIAAKDWDTFIQQPTVTFADLPRKASTESRVNSLDISANAINRAQLAYPNITGANITVSLKEDLFDTTDIDIAGRYIYNPQASASIASHATIMATMIAGAGNSGEKGLGAASHATLCPADFNYSLLPEDSNYIRAYHVSIQNHSYGTGIENYYGTEAMAFDEQVYESDTLLHVFSSGNIGTDGDSAGLYQGLNGYANLSGNFKQAKNILVIGATDDSLHVPALSSKGPAYDGRVKPELVAYGIDGTSGAAALTSGITALLQDAYKQQYNTAPSAALVKALLINSATTVNNRPLSYSSGYGSIHAFYALHDLQHKQFMQGNSNGDFTIQVPEGMQSLKVTLCWNDPPANANAANALINDLDLTVTDAQGNTYLPWVLSAIPVADSLAAAPHRARDSLNNTEQVSISTPPEGTLHIHVAAKHLNTPSQAFYIAYSFQAKQHFEWQSPAPKQVILAGSSVPFPLRWETNLNGKGDIQVSFDKGSSWLTIASQVNTATSLFYWSIPDTFTTALFKYITPDTSFISDTVYLSPRLTLQTGYDCGESAMIFWNNRATAYQVYHMGDEYLLPYTQTVDTFLTISSPAITSPYYVVSPIHPDGWTGLKSYATNYQLQGTGCYIKNLLADITTDNNVALTLMLGTTYQLQKFYWERLSGNSYISLDTAMVNNSTTYMYEDKTAPEGLLYYRIRFLTTAGQVIYSDPVSINMLRQHDYMVFPNPVSSTLNVISKSLNTMQVQLFDMGGKRVYETSILGTQSTLSLNGLAAGIYICVIFDNGKKVFSTKVVKL
jgi:hypothetical protein